MFRRDRVLMSQNLLMCYNNIVKLSFISRTSVIEFILIIPKSASLAPSVLYFTTCQFYLSFRFNIYSQALLSSSSLKYDGQPCPVVRLTLEANTGHMTLSFFIHGIVIVQTHVINSKSNINWLFFISVMVFRWTLGKRPHQPCGFTLRPTVRITL